MQKSNDYIRERVIAEANYIVGKQTTVRATARAYNISKSTVHKDVTLKNGKKHVYCILDFAMLKFIWRD